MTPAGVGAAHLLAAFGCPEWAFLAAEGGGGAASLGTIVGILLYGGIAFLVVRLAIRWAEGALTPPAEADPRGAARSPAGSDRAGG